VQVLHIVGGKNTVAVPPGQPPYAVVPFVEQMHLAYAAADFVLCRCGAMTCAEVSAVGLPAAYVPYPHGNGEQRFNARPIVLAGGGLLVEDATLRPSWIVEHLIPIMTDPCRLATMSRSAASAGSRDADVVLARAVLNVAAEHRRFGTVR
jgi:UDP-N-acetylglucosamine--N-acetylmuramyl-(pentapeptide) pyrophosphoryl-undecaprenol N-acetylglucosamine transferase